MMLGEDGAPTTQTIKPNPKRSIKIDGTLEVQPHIENKRYSSHTLHPLKFNGSCESLTSPIGR